MFSAKNYGLPKDLIEAAKRVHEKQLEEQQVPIVKAPKGPNKERPSEASPEIRSAANRYDDEAEMSLKLGELSKKLENERKKKKHPTYIQSRYHKGDTYEEVQFTEEELAEAFAIFLEENFHVDMLTEEDLDYIFENEFPQWLEEGLSITPKTDAQIKKEEEEERKRREEQRKRDDEEAIKNEKIPMV